MKKKLVITVIIFISAVLFFRPTRVYENIELVQILKGQNELSSNFRLIFEGERQNRFFKPPVFSGDIKINDRTFEVNKLETNTHELVSTLSISDGDDFLDVTNYMWIYVSSSFDEVSITSYEVEGLFEEHGLMFAGPARDVDEAIEIHDKHH